MPKESLEQWLAEEREALVAETDRRLATPATAPRWAEVLRAAYDWSEAVACYGRQSFDAARIDDAVQRMLDAVAATADLESGSDTQDRPETLEHGAAGSRASLRKFLDLDEADVLLALAIQKDDVRRTRERIHRLKQLLEIELGYPLPRDSRRYFHRVCRLFVDGLACETVVMARATIESLLREKLEVDDHLARPLALVSDAAKLGCIRAETAIAAREVVTKAGVILHRALPDDVQARKAVEAVAMVVRDLSP